MRTFFATAIPLTRELDTVLQQLARMRPRLRVVTGTQLHVTLHFLGETSPEQIPALTTVLERVANDSYAVSATLTGLGAFPRPSAPAVVWAGFPDATVLSDLAASLSEACLKLGFPREDRKYRPHVTLARVSGRPPSDLAELLAAHASTSFGEVPLETVTLYRSDPGPAGPVYTALAKNRLASPQ